MKTITRDEWKSEGDRLYGNFKNWKFKCVSCGTVQTMQDFIDAGIPADRAGNFVYQECIGRHTKEKGCDWCLYGLFQIHTKEVEFEGTKVPVFEFAEIEKP
uniref:Uncharacterized protein n=1 Tax=viral metagenome TaxID=1070528 RepID=A0A6M3JLZ7_9ZZZZ